MKLIMWSWFVSICISSSLLVLLVLLLRTALFVGTIVNIYLVKKRLEHCRKVKIISFSAQQAAKMEFIVNRMKPAPEKSGKVEWNHIIFYFVSHSLD